jgi:hypothetical protein
MMCLLSCSNNDDIQDIQTVQNTADLEPDRIWLYLADWPLNNAHSWEYKFTYENGNLKKMSGQLADTFSYDYNRIVTYMGNKVTIESFPNNDNYRADKLIYTIENGRPINAEMYDSIDELMFKKNYTYESNKIKVYINWYDVQEIYITYYFDSNNNLIKSEKLEKEIGIDRKLTITNYSDFDTAKNPYKKLYLLNDTFYEKSLSANNYRKIKGTIQQFYTLTPMPPVIFENNCNYTYDINGQIILHFPTL